MSKKRNVIRRWFGSKKKSKSNEFPINSLKTPKFDNSVVTYPKRTFLFLTGLGRHIFFINGKTGKLMAAGCNKEGQLGLGNEVDQFVPVSVNIFKDREIADVSTGEFFTLFQTKSRGIFGTGLVDPFVDPSIELGINMRDFSVNNNNICSFSISTPVPVQLEIDSATVIQIEAGSDCCYFLSSEGDVFSRGRNMHGQLCLGLKDSIVRGKAKKIPYSFDDEKIVRVVGGFGRVAFLSESSRVYVGGRNDGGQHGIGNKEHQFLPIELQFFRDEVVKDITFSGEESFFLTEKCQVFVAANKTILPLPFLGVRQISGKTVNGLLFQTVDGDCLEYGLSDRIEKGTLATLVDKNIIQIACNLDNFYFIGANGDVYGVGKNASGQMMNNSKSNCSFNTVTLLNKGMLFKRNPNYGKRGSKSRKESELKDEWVNIEIVHDDEDVMNLEIENEKIKNREQKLLKRIEKFRQEKEVILKDVERRVSSFEIENSKLKSEIFQITNEKRSLEAEILRLNRELLQKEDRIGFSKSRNQSLLNFLTEHGLEMYFEKFAGESISIDDFPYLTESDVEQIFEKAFHMRRFFDNIKSIQDKEGEKKPKTKLEKVVILVKWKKEVKEFPQILVETHSSEILKEVVKGFGIDETKFQQFQLKLKGGIVLSPKNQETSLKKYINEQGNVGNVRAVLNECIL